MLQRLVVTLDHAPATHVVRYISPLLESIGVCHGFSTRLGGVSTGPLASMNLGNPSGCSIQDTPDHLSENHRRLFAAAGLRPDLRHARVHQVHGSDVVDVRAGAAHDPHDKADSLVTDDPGSIVSVRTADCVPVLLASADGAIVAAVHAGWRGVVGGVVPATLARMQHLAAGRGHTIDPGNLTVAIGPSIGVDAFEVGMEVIAEFASVFAEPLLRRVVRLPEQSDRPPASPAASKAHIDLREALRLQLVQGGVSPSNIDVSDRCTVRDAGEFFSHRRDAGVKGRMASFIATRSG